MDQLINWIKKEESKGYTSEQLRETLISQGYNEKDIDKAIKESGKKKIHSVLIFSIIGIAVLLGFIIFTFYKLSMTVDNTNEISKIENTQPTNNNAKTTKTATNSKENNNSQTNPLASNIEVFEKSFSSCTPDVFYQSFGDMSYEYNIIGLDGKFCAVQSKYLTAPNSDWLGKTMTCLYNNSISFIEATSDDSRCSGELWDTLN